MINRCKTLLRKLCDAVWQALRIVSTAPTPKARATKKRLLPASDVPNLTIITGDPQHCIIKVRSLVSPHVSDGTDFKFDYIDMINRLSKEIRDEENPANVDPPSLTAASRELL